VDGQAAPNPRHQKLQRKQALWNERSSWMSHWREISEYQQPRLGRFVVSDTNKGERKHNNILDSTALRSAGILAAGMMSGMTSPARPWFRLTLRDRDLVEFGPVKTWLHRTGQLLRDVFAASNTYNSLHTGYEELGLFGTWSDILLPDFDNVVHHYPLTVGEYAIATDHRGKVDTICRELSMTVSQCVEQFGKDACSTTIKNLWERGSYDSRVEVIHLIQPRRNRDPMKRDAKHKRFESCYFEAGQDNWGGYLSESGFDRFPALSPRWVVRGNDIYGHSPGMEVLGDVKSLQHQQLRKAQGIDYKVNPPLQVPATLKDMARARLPGGIAYYDSTGPNAGVRTQFNVDIDLQHLLLDIQDVRDRIRAGYFADMFLLMANDTRSNVTATEVAERHEEKLLMLGPVLERLHNELLSPMVDMTFDYCAEAGILPPIPQELEDMDIDIEFVSTLAQAQRAVSAQGMDRLLGTISNLAALKPEVMDKVDFDQAIDDYAEFYGVNPEIVVPDDVVAQLRADRAQQQQAMQAAAAAPVVADTAKTASEIDPAALTDVMQQFTGYSTPAGG
jgi:hypothetical protein